MFMISKGTKIKQDALKVEKGSFSNKWKNEQSMY